MSRRLHVSRLVPHFLACLGLVVGALALACFPGPSAAQTDPQTDPQTEARDTESNPVVVIEGSTARLGDRVLRHPVREAQLVEQLGPPERARYRLHWPGLGVLAVPSDREGEIEELVFVLCEGAPEAIRVGVFPGTVRLDGQALSCDASREEAVAALPEDFTHEDELKSLVHARRGALEIVLSVSSWDGWLSLSLGFPDPASLPPVEPEVRNGT